MTEKSFKALTISNKKAGAASAALLPSGADYKS